MKRNKTKPVEDPNAAIMAKMFPDLPTSDENDEVSEKSTQTSDSDTKIAELMTKLAAMEEKMNATAQANLQLMTQPVVDPVPQRRAVPDKAPDPVDNPDQYAQYVQQKTQADIDYQREVNNWQNRQAAQGAARLQNLWQQFGTSYPDYVENEERVEIAATRVLAKAQAAGYDTQKYMYGNTNAFMAEVAKTMDNLFGKPDADDDNDDDDDNTPEVRTAGIFGGAEGGHKATGGRKAPEPMGSISNDIKAWQQKTGFHR